jgi:cystathionine gamma-synthase
MDDQSRPHLKARTLLCQALGAGDASTHAVVPPIHMSTTYLRDADNGYSSGYVYGRSDNVTVQQAEALISALEGADEAMMFSSGMAAATAVFMALDRPTHIVASQVMYWGLRSWLLDIGRQGHSVTFVESSDLDAVRAAVRPGKT